MSLYRLLDQIEAHLEENDGVVDFSDLVSGKSDYEIIPLEPDNPKDEDLVDAISSASNTLLDRYKRSNRRVNQNRANEVGNTLEDEFIDVMESEAAKKNLDYTIEKLGRAGYPDIMIVGPNDRLTYLEMKATSAEWDATGRRFYYTTGKKLEGDGRHLLLGMHIEEKSDHHWTVNGWKLADLMHLEANLKIEFNATNQDLYSDDMVVDEGE